MRRFQDDTYTCHCEKIEDFRGNPKNTCVALDYFVTVFLVMTVIIIDSCFRHPELVSGSFVIQFLS